jgi:hypothetical protein
MTARKKGLTDGCKSIKAPRHDDVNLSKEVLGVLSRKSNSSKKRIIEKAPEKVSRSLPKE